MNYFLLVPLIILVFSLLLNMWLKSELKRDLKHKLNLKWIFVNQENAHVWLMFRFNLKDVEDFCGSYFGWYRIMSLGEKMPAIILYKLKPELIMDDVFINWLKLQRKS